jgi:hypothetical protein
MKKIIGLLLIVCALPASVFAQDGEAGEHRHEALDMLLGVNLGLSLFWRLKNIDTGSPELSYLYSADLGLGYDFYPFYWLSVNSGLMLHPQIVLLYKPEYAENPDIAAANIVQTPLCLTIPLQAHINIPRAEWFYLGTGINLNIPLTSFTVETQVFDTKGKFFISIPIDIGFDMTKSRDGGGRFMFRFTTVFLEKKILVPFGVIWQIYNFRIGS